MCPTDMAGRYATNAPRVIYELFEHEIVIVNLDTGRYYSVQDVGVAIWNAIAAGASVDETVGLLTVRYDAESATIATAVTALVDELSREGLIVARPAAAPRFEDGAAGSTRTGRVPFQAPSLQTYTDMQDLLLLDPIHEVDESGWPVPAPKAASDVEQ